MKSLELLGEPAKDTKSSKKKKRKNLKNYSKGFVISGSENVLKGIEKQKFDCEQSQNKNTNSSLNHSSKKGATKTDSYLQGDIESTCEDQRIAHNKQKKKALLSFNQQPETDATQTIEMPPLENDVQSFVKKKKHKRRMYIKPKEEDSFTTDNDDLMEPIKKKRKLLNPSKDEYYPGMLSEMLQIKKFGRLIIPWDPSFGLDPNYKIPECNEEGLPKLKINPLFDLSKRNDQPSKDNTRKSIFVGNLPDDTNIMKLKKLFRKCGLILHAKLRKREFNQKNVHAAKRDVKDKKPVNAIVKFSSFESCEAALKMNGELHEGHHLRVTLANDDKKADPAASVFLGNLPFNIEDDDLWKAFGECGPIESVRVVRDERSGKAKGFGFVNFKSADSVEAAVKLNGCLILNREIRVRRHESGPSSLSDSFTVKRPRKRKKKIVADDELCHSETNLGREGVGNEEKNKSKEKLKIKNKEKQLQLQESERVIHQKLKQKKKLHKKQH